MSNLVGFTSDFVGSVATLIGDAALGNAAALVKLIEICIETKNIGEVIFLNKLDRFWRGVKLTESERTKLCANLVEYSDKEESAMRIVNCIDKAASNKIVDYLVNATRCLVMDFINVEEYFRICNALVNTIEEDLKFLQKHIGEDEEYEYSIYTSGLSISGLVHQSNITWKGKIFYKFTFLAHLVDQFALSYGDTARYPNPKQRAYADEGMTTNIDPKIDLATKEDIDKMFEK